jgi:hypothetical protein
MMSVVPAEARTQRLAAAGAKARGSRFRERRLFFVIPAKAGIQHCALRHAKTGFRLSP